MKTTYSADWASGAIWDVDGVGMREVTEMDNQQINLDFDKRVVMNADDLAWVSSPAAGVWRKQFERAAAESGRVTSIVRYEAGTRFRSHQHPMGEEILVLEGVFSDEQGDYPAGTYLRNPLGSQHAPYSKEGCLIFVKLEHFLPDDNQQVVMRPDERQWLPGQGNLKVIPLHDHLGEHTALVQWPKGERFQPHKHWGGEEILVLEGELADEHGIYPRYTWLRNPHLSEHYPYTDQGALIFVKVGHLPV